MIAGDLWIATGNAKKLAELERLLLPLSVRLHALHQAPVPVTIVEDRPDFAGNAEVKAKALARAVGAPAVGDDSGLCVDALDGAPGVHSSRWAGPEATDGDRIALLLRRMSGVPAPRRTARFTCCVCLADAGGRVLATFQDSCEGRILDGPRGDGGFGYDPVFAPAELEAAGDPRSFAELTAAEKDRIGHRGRALRALAAWLAAAGRSDGRPAAPPK